MDQDVNSQKEDITKSFDKLKRRIEQLDVSTNTVIRLGAVSEIRVGRKRPLVSWRRIYTVSVKCAFLCACLAFIPLMSYRYHWPMSRQTLYKCGAMMMGMNFTMTGCLVKVPFINSWSHEVFRPRVSCDICKNVDGIDRVTLNSISADELMAKYVYPIRPVLIEGAINLTAMGVTFDFEFIQKLYGNASSSGKNEHPLCEFEKYLTHAGTVQELLDMEPEEVNSPGGSDSRSWYVGWANCDRYVTEELMKYFRPTYFPDIVGFSKTYWFYVGSPGHGFVMHIDPRFTPQWQTVVHGLKKFKFLPPPECYFECKYKEMEVIIKPGDTLIFHGGQWFHETENIGDTVVVALGTSIHF